MFKKNFIKICNDRGIPPTTVCQKIGLTAATFSKWTDESVPRKSTLYKLADFLNVTVDDLLSDGSSTTFISYKHDEKERAQVQEIVNSIKETAKNLAEEPEQHLYKLEQSRVYMIPLFESISAGFGALAINEVVDYVPLYFRSSYEASETICIKVQGDSMSPKIEDGDIIQVHKQESVDSGRIAVVLLDGNQGLVKKLVYGENWIELHSLNPMYKTMRFNGEQTSRVSVLGLVKAVTKMM